MCSVFPAGGNTVGTRFTGTGTPEDNSGLEGNPDEVNDDAIRGIAEAGD